MSQQLPANLLDLEERAHKLFSNHTAIEILDILGRGESLPGTLSANQQALHDAVAMLNQLGLVDPQPHAAAAPSAYQTVALTPRGRSLVDLLEEIAPNPT